MDDTVDLFAGVPQPKPLSRVKQRLIRSAVEIEADDPDSILFQHTVLCQTSLPYRDPGEAIRVWDRKQGRVSLRIRAGEVADSSGEWVQVGLPFGPKPRLLLYHLNAEALRTGSPVLEVEASLTAFVKRIGLATHGRNIGVVKDQLTRLSAAHIRMAIEYAPDRSRQVNTQIISGFDLWLPKDDRQRVLWPTTVCLSSEYFASLQHHAVPLDERAVATLAHNTMALDVYSWLAQRLHRVAPGKPAFIPWTALRDQFGQGYGRIDNFKRVFLHTLRLVHTQYNAAKIDFHGRGMTLHHSPTAVKGRVYLIPKG